MASGDKEPPKCHVCTSPFRFTGPDPYLMPCLHSVCQTCMALDSENICCSSCKQQFPNSDSFPKDTAEAKSIFLATLKNRPSEVCCTNRNDGKKATSWCPQCEALLCMTYMKHTKSHEVTTLSSLLQEQEGLNPTAISCTHHPELQLVLYDQTCDKLICYKCKAEDHGECESPTNEVACGQFKDLYLTEAVIKLKEKKEDIALIENEIHDLSNILDPKLKAVKESIHQSFENLRATLNQRETDLIEQAEKCFKTVKENTNQRLAELNLENVRLEAALSLCWSSHDLSFSPQLLSMKSSMTNRLDECLERELPKVSTMEADIQFSNNDEQDLKHVISSSGSLYSTWSKAKTSPSLPSGILTEIREQMKVCQAENRKAEGQLSVCIEKLKNVKSFKEKASFTMSFEPDFIDNVNSSEKVLRTLTWYIKVQKNREKHGKIGAFIMLQKLNDRLKPGWSCQVNATFKVENTPGSPITKYLVHEFNPDSAGRGYGSLISKDWLHGTKTIQLQVDLEVGESKGLDPLEDRLRKEFKETLEILGHGKSC